MSVFHVTFLEAKVLINANTGFYVFQIKRPDVIYSYIVYIKDQWDLDPGVCDMEELRLCALIMTNKGFVNPSLEAVHFTVEFGNKVNLEKEFPSKLCLMNVLQGYSKRLLLIYIEQLNLYSSGKEHWASILKVVGSGGIVVAVGVAG